MTGEDEALDDGGGAHARAAVDDELRRVEQALWERLLEVRAPRAGDAPGDGVERLRVAAPALGDCPRRGLAAAMAKLDAEVDRLVASAALDEEQAEFIKEQIRLYPDKISAELKRAGAAETAAGKPSGAEALLHATAKAMVASGDAKDENEAIVKLGGALTSPSKNESGT